MVAVVMRRNDDEPIDLARSELEIDRVLARRRIERSLLAAASREVVGAKSWFALRVEPRCETEVRMRLDRLRVEAAVPIRQVQVKRRFRAESRRTIERAVLSGLVFVRLVASNAAFAGLLRVKGVAAIVGKEGAPYPIGNQEMQEFMELAQAGAFNERCTANGIAVGSRVRIRVGPFADAAGIFEGYGKARGARVRTMLFGREMTVDVKLANIEESH